MGNHSSKRKTSLNLLELPDFIRDKCFQYLSTKDLQNLAVAFPKLKWIVYDHISSSRPLFFSVISRHDHLGCFSDKFILEYFSPFDIRPDKKNAFKKPRRKKQTILNDSTKGWKAFWQDKVLNTVQDFTNLRTLKLRGSGLHGGGLFLQVKWLQKLSVSLPHLSTLSMFQGVLACSADDYSAPVGLFRAKFSGSTLSNTQEVELCFPALKTLKLGYPNQAAFDLLARPSVVPNLERLFVMSKTYIAGLFFLVSTEL